MSNALQYKASTLKDSGIFPIFVGCGWGWGVRTYIHTYIHKLYLSSDFSVAYIASISDPN